MLLTKPLSALFFAIYILCIASDILDGYVARKTKTTSKHGEVLDSVADLVLAGVLLYIFIPLLTLEPWMLRWIGGIAFIRVLASAIGCIRYHTFPFLHTHANKVTGVALVCFPVLYQLAGLSVTVSILCGIASLSALEELLITVRSKQLDRNIKGILDLKKGG